MNARKYILLPLMLALGLGVLPARGHNPANGHPTTTTVTCAPNPVVVNAPATCTATVTDVIGGGQDAVPTGTVTFSSSGAGSFSATTCTLAPTSGFSASCSVTHTPTTIGIRTITANYPVTTNAFHRFGTSFGTTILTAVLAPPTVAKAFNPAQIGTAGTSVLTITLSNANLIAITGVAFTDTYPANLVNAPTPAGSTTCAGGTVTAVAAGSSVALSGGTIPASGSCTVTVSVTSSTAGSYTNTIAIGAVTSTNAASNTAAASATLTVLARPSVAKAFSPTPIGTGATSTLTITLSNSNTTAITGAAFTDTYPVNLVNASTPAGSTTCAGGTVTAVASGGSVALSGGTIPASGSCTVTVSVTSSTAGSYTNTIAVGAVTSTNAGSNSAAASATLTVNVIVTVTSFDAVEAGASPNSNLYTKLSAVDFTVDVLALDSANLVSSGYTGTVTLAVVDASTGGGVCASMTSLQALGSLTFIAANAGRKTTSAINYAGAARNAKIRITDAVLGVTSCSFNAFAIRPTSFAVTSNMTNTGTSGTPFIDAGGNFTLNAAAPTGYDGTPTIDSTRILAHAGAIQTGSITGVFAAAAPATGIASGSTFTYSEVGNFQFLAQGVIDDTFTAVDQPGDCINNFSNTLAGGKYGCKIGNTAATAFFGRFTPNQFLVTKNTPRFDPACTAGEFSYVGQGFGYASGQQPVATVTAVNALGVTTRNYTGPWRRLINTTLTPGTQSGRYAAFTGTLDTSNLPAIAGDPAIVDLTGASSGSFTLTFSSTGELKFTRTTPVAPFDADIGLSINVTDADGIIYSSNPLTFGAATAGNGILFAGAGTPKKMRFGRLRLGNAFGSALLDLPLPLSTQYYDGSFFATNTADSCTSLVASDIGFGFLAATPTLIACETHLNPAGAIAFVSGRAAVRLTKPGDTNNGAVDLTVNLGAVPSGITCTSGISSAATAANKTWLQGNWGSGTYNENPRGRATFGIFKNADQFLYFREVY